MQTVVKKGQNVILDPPRAGSTPTFRQQLSLSEENRIRELRCDLKPEILDSGFAIERVTPVDMFRQHVETGARSKLDVDSFIEVKIRLDLTSTESKASYAGKRSK